LAARLFGFGACLGSFFFFFRWFSLFDMGEALTFSPVLVKDSFPFFFLTTPLHRRGEEKAFSFAKLE